VLRLFGFLISRVTTVVYLMRHPGVPRWLKPVPVLVVAYVVFPHDFLRDYIPVLGWLDDVWVVIFGMSLFIYTGRWFASHRPRTDGKTIATTGYQVLDDDEGSDKPE
jgi:uncharacterized membrane protein YkvA (DUF1232 family)